MTGRNKISPFQMETDEIDFQNATSEDITPKGSKKRQAYENLHQCKYPILSNKRPPQISSTSNWNLSCTYLHRNKYSLSFSSGIRTCD